jgi:hypothetical protein
MASASFISGAHKIGSARSIISQRPSTHAWNNSRKSKNSRKRNLNLRMLKTDNEFAGERGPQFLILIQGCFCQEMISFLKLQNFKKFCYQIQFIDNLHLILLQTCTYMKFSRSSIALFRELSIFFWRLNLGCLFFKKYVPLLLKIGRRKK